MTRITKYLGVSMLIAGLALAAAVQTAAQDTSGQAAQSDRRAGPDGRGGRGPGRGRFGGPGGPDGRMGLSLAPMALDRLSATDAQRQAIRSIEESHATEFRSVRERDRSAHDALRAAVNAGVFDEGTIRARSAEVAAVQADAAVLQARVRTEVFAVLTPEQREQAAQMPHARGRGPAF